MLRHVVFVRSNVSEEHSTSIIRVTRIGELGTLAVTSNWHTLRSMSCHPDDGGATFLRNVSSYKSHSFIPCTLDQIFIIIITTIIFVIIIIILFSVCLTETCCGYYKTESFHQFTGLPILLFMPAL
jgi:hypothetical protein